MNISLRKPKISDLEEFQKIFDDIEVAKQLDGFKYPLSLEDAKIQLQKIIDLNNKGNYYEFVIAYNNELVGLVCLEKPSQDKHTFTLGFALGKKYWNKGITTLAVKKILDFGFKKLKLKRIVADNDESNPASGRVLEKSGFKFVKVIRKRRGNTRRKINTLFWEKTV